VGRAMRTLGFLLRLGSDFQNVQSFRTLYVSLVRPLLEYATVVWSPHYAVHSAAIERVQRKFLRFINFKLGFTRDELDYTNLMRLLNLNLLEDRRRLLDVSFLYKLLRGEVDSIELLSKIGLHIPTRNTRQCVTFHELGTSVNYVYGSPIPRLHRLGNELCTGVDIFVDSLPVLKGSIRKTFSC
jgi:hypothetical protein